MNWDPKVLARHELRGLWVIAPLLLAIGPIQVVLGTWALVDGGHELNWVWIIWGLALFGSGIHNAFRIPKVKATLAQLEQADSEPADPECSRSGLLLPLQRVQ
jgi:hypothetical protein